MNLGGGREKGAPAKDDFFNVLFLRKRKLVMILIKKRSFVVLPVANLSSGHITTRFSYARTPLKALPFFPWLLVWEDTLDKKGREKKHKRRFPRRTSLLVIYVRSWRRSLFSSFLLLLLLVGEVSGGAEGAEVGVPGVGHGRGLGHGEGEVVGARKPAEKAKRDTSRKV